MLIWKVWCCQDEPDSVVLDSTNVVAENIQEAIGRAMTKFLADGLQEFVIGGAQFEMEADRTPL